MSLLTDARAGSSEAAQSDTGAEHDGESKLGDMDPLALVFLESPIARKLVVAWQTCGGDEDAWLDYAGISRSEAEDARRLCFALLENKICLKGGKTAPIVLSYIRTIVAAPLNAALKKQQGGGRRGRR